MSNFLVPKHKLLKDECMNVLRDLNVEDKKTYANYLAQTYYYVNHSEKLLALAGALFSNDDRPVMRRFFKHLSEESAHDQMLLKDINALGYKLEDFPENVQTKMFWETQYYKVEHVDPICLLGYIYFLEDLACDICPELTKRVINNHGIRSASFLKLHGEEDPDHVEKAYEQIMRLSPKRKDLISINFEQSALTYIHMISVLKTQDEEKHLAA